ncbi:hypothetical protein O3P69_017521 [Scylla paramamosain]|uniref:CCHC-type domain-containing protein n=1 Tax=Scylla paramamosain TaxID=85552 RepID=A0AAW0TWA2_SCYPA
MGRVKINQPRPKELASCSLLPQRCELLVSSPTTDSVVVLTATDKDTDAIFQEDVLQKLSSENFTAILPPDLKAQRTVLCFRLDDLVYQYEAFPPHQIKEETYIPLLTCNTCYAIEDHSTKQCPCSECGSNGHTFRECSSPIKQCLHCGQAHSCMAMHRPARKKAYKEKEERLRTESTRSTSISYAQAASPPASERYIETEPYRPCTTPSASLAMNGLPDIKLPPNPPSQAIIRAITGKMSPVQDPRKDLLPPSLGRTHLPWPPMGKGTHPHRKKKPSKSELHSERSQHAGPPPEQRTRTSRQRKQVRPKTGR